MNNEQFIKLADLAKIECTAEEEENFLKGLQEMLFYFNELQNVDTENVVPFYGFSDENSDSEGY